MSSFELGDLEGGEEFGQLIKVWSWKTNESHTMKAASCTQRINNLLRSHSLLIYRFNPETVSLKMPSSENEMAKYLSQDQTERLRTVLNFDRVHGSLDLMKISDDSGYLVDAVNFGLPLKSLHLTGAVCDSILSDQVRTF